MTDTPHLGLPFIEGSQAQKHVTHNEALRILDALVQIGVLDADRTAPPLSPVEGDRHIVASGATGAWAGQAKAIALYEDGGWRFFAPRAGWCAWSAADSVLLVHDGAAWGEVASGGGGDGGDGGGIGDSVAKLGVNDTATAPNLLTVRSSDALFHAIEAADGGSGNVRLQIAKEGAANTASVFFSDAYAGHAEFGLTGDNDFHLKVSADGTTWRDAVTFDRTTGRASFPGGGVREILAANRTYYVRTDGSDSNNGLSNTSGGAFLTLPRAQLAVQQIDLAGFAVTVKVADGTYTDPWRMVSAPVGGQVSLIGNTTTPSNCIISVTNGVAVSIETAINFIVSGFKLTTTGSNAHGIFAVGGAYVTFSKMDFGSVGGIHIAANYSSEIIADVTAPNYSISGSAVYHIRSLAGSAVNVANATITLSGTLSYTAFVYAARNAEIQAYGNTFTGGTVTGKRFDAANLGLINTNGGGANYFPGNAAGTGTNPGTAPYGLYL